MSGLITELEGGNYSIIIEVIRRSNNEVEFISSRSCPNHFIHAILSRSIPLSYEVSDPEPIRIKNQGGDLWALTGNTEYYADRLGYALHYWENGTYTFSAASLREYCIASSAWVHEQWAKGLNGHEPDYHGESFPISPAALSIELK